MGSATSSVLSSTTGANRSPKSEPCPSNEAFFCCPAFTRATFASCMGSACCGAVFSSAGARLFKSARKPLKSNSAYNARNSSIFGQQTVKSSSLNSIGTSRRIVVSTFAKRKRSSLARMLAPVLPPILSALAMIFSTSPHACTILQAPFSPTPGTPGMLSEESPHRAKISRTSSGLSIPYFAFMASLSTISMPSPFCL